MNTRRIVRKAVQKAKKNVLKKLDRSDFDTDFIKKTIDKYEGYRQLVNEDFEAYKNRLINHSGDQSQIDHIANYWENSVYPMLDNRYYSEALTAVKKLVEELKNWEY